MSLMPLFDKYTKELYLHYSPLPVVDFWSIPILDPEPEPPPPPAKCSKCQEPFPYEAHESGKCYRCRGGK